MSADIGDVFEKQLQDVFRKLNDRHLLQWHAFPDHKRSAGGAVGNQPSDYLVGLPPGSSLEQRMIFLEAKASDKYDSLQKSMVRASQRGFINTWGGLIDLPYLIVFYSAPANTLEIWDGQCVTRGRLSKSHHLLATLPNAGSGRTLNQTAVADFLATHFALPPKAITLTQYQSRNP